MIVADIFTGSLTEIFILAAECQQEAQARPEKVQLTIMHAGSVRDSFQICDEVLHSLFKLS